MIFAIKYGEFGEDTIGINSYNDLYSAYRMLENEGRSDIEIYKIESKLEKPQIDNLLKSINENTIC